MEEVSIIGLDLAKNIFRVHGAAQDGRRVFSRNVRRANLLQFFEAAPRCIVAMEACASSHYWAREIGAFGHTAKLIPPAYVKPYVKRQKNDANDAEAIAEAACRPTMRFVAVKSTEKQAAGMALSTRDLFVRQRTQTINALRGHLAEHGVTAPVGTVHLSRLQSAVDDPDTLLPEAVVHHARLMLNHIEMLRAEIIKLEDGMRHEAGSNEVARRLMTIPGVGPITGRARSSVTRSSQL